jgi:hypothetical protein
MARRVRLGRSRFRAPGETTKDRMIAELVTARQNILDAVAALSPHQQDQVFLGEWSVKELLAHLIGWDYTYIAALEELLAGEVPSFYSAHDADWASYNRNIVDQYKKDNWVELLGTVEESHRKLSSFLQTIPDEEFDRDRGVRYQGTLVTITRLLKAEARDELEHYDQIRRWSG